MSNEIEIVATYVEPEESPVAYHARALAYWNAKRGDRFAPTWKDISLIEFEPRVIPLISVTDITEKPLRSTYRYWGSGLTTAFAGDFTGRSVADVPPKSLGVNGQSGCGRILRDRAPHVQVREYRNARDLRGRAIILRLPLSDDGETVNHGLNVYYFESARDDQVLSDFFHDTLYRLDR